MTIGTAKVNYRGIAVVFTPEVTERSRIFATPFCKTISVTPGVGFRVKTRRGRKNRLKPDQITWTIINH